MIATSNLAMFARWQNIIEPCCFAMRSGSYPNIGEVWHQWVVTENKISTKSVLLRRNNQ